MERAPDVLCVLPGLADRVGEAALAAADSSEPPVSDETKDDETSSVEMGEIVAWVEVDEAAEAEETSAVLVLEITVVEVAGLLATA
jgi:hypothetical protein